MIARAKRKARDYAAWHRRNPVATAFHESAHAITFLAQGWGLEEVTVEPSGISVGLTTVTHPLPSSSDNAGRAIWCALAGWAAESIFFGRMPALPLGEMCDSDIGMARAFARKLGHRSKPDQDRLLRQAYRSVRRFLRRHWPAVQRLACELQRRRTMRAGEIVATLMAA